MLSASSAAKNKVFFVLDFVYSCFASLLFCSWFPYFVYSLFLSLVFSHFGTSSHSGLKPVSLSKRRGSCCLEHFDHSFIAVFIVFVVPLSCFDFLRLQHHQDVAVGPIDIIF